ncbi:MAG: 2-hydroxyhepta-2,4-diene-1,7-dioate isomerase [Pirellulaceae bacterium]|nr:MAG: 2-hydroxyhepta-2,4-diene-1,7-dioate isomerase [Pirellulaceae bacterium]
MHLAKLLDSVGEPAVGVVEGDAVEVLDLRDAPFRDLNALLTLSPAELAATVRALPRRGERFPVDRAGLLPPIDRQEVWAAGVTYKRSQTARMEESEAAKDCYDRVYQSPRPELFFKATPYRVRGTGQALRIRQDATWNVPEPELALVLNPRLEIVGYTIGNDMSSRDIEGENPLYLPQAKVYDQCCGLGPWITLAEAMPPHDQIGISLRVLRHAEVAFEGATSVAEMARKFDELVGWLGRDNTFPHGAFLLTGTGIVPDSDFTLAAGDRIEIRIDGIGALINEVVQA